MSRRRCARNNTAAFVGTPFKGKGRSFFFACAVLLVFQSLAFLPVTLGQAFASPAATTADSGAGAKKTGTKPTSATQIVVSISVNTEPKGDFFVEIDDAGNLFVKPEDLNALNLKYTKDRAVLMDSEQYVPLSDVLDVRYTFDEKKLTLAFIGKTTDSRKTSVDIFSLQPKRQNLYYPRDTSAFLNYGLTYSYADTLGFQSFSMSNKIGARTGDVFFTSDSLYTKTETNSQFVRLQTAATYERRNDLQWLVMGDQFANSGDLGSSVNMGGIGFSKLYKLDPYFITQPMFNLNGVTQFPSEADIYMDGVLVSKQQVAPGQFELKNIYSYTGSHMVDVILKDPFGNEQRISYPLYFSTQLLREGLQEYSYNVGFLRERYGVESNDYGKAVFSAFHRYGVTSAFNIGARAEGSEGVYNGGLSTALLVPRLGAFAISVAASSAKGVKGSAVSFQHSYQFGSFNTTEQFREYSGDYATVAVPASPAMTKYAENLTAGFRVGFGSFSLGYSTSETYNDLTTRVLSANYSRILTNTASLFATASSTKTTTVNNSFYIGINFNLDKNIHGTAQASRTGDTNTETIQVQKDTPIGEGLGYRALLNRSDNGSTTSYGFDPMFQYNAGYGIYTFDSEIQNSAGRTTENYNVAASGSFVYAGGFFGASRPVNDSFSIVMVEDVPGAKVLNNGQEIGTTNSSGTMVVPTLTSYAQNQITLDVKNIPIDYSISGVNAKISPSVWGGSCVSFDSVKIRALTGTLYIVDGHKKSPLEFVDIMLKVGDREIAFPTGKGGEMYIENRLTEEAKPGAEDKQSCAAIAKRKKAGGNVIQPGTYQASVDYQVSKCVFSVTFPSTDDPITDVGEVDCVVKGAPAPVKKAEPAPDGNAEPVAVEKAAPALKAEPVAIEKAELAPKPAAKRFTFVIRPAFDGNGAPVREKDRKTFARIADMLKGDPDLGVEIEVHGDRHGTNAASKRIGMKKANAIRKYLIRSGVSASSIAKVESMGNKKLICREPTTACDKINRRGVIRIVPEDAAGPGLLSMQTEQR